MAVPRHLLVSNESASFQHIMCRCVRRAWLCGYDAASGRSFEHRREWIRRRIVQLSQLFAIDTYAYAVMANHYHIVVYVDPQRVNAWGDEEVVRRWLMVCPPRWLKSLPTDEMEGHPVFEKHVQAVLAERELVAMYRERLGNLGWFMRFLNEYVARRANAEDEVTGRFWEARYRSQELLDEAAVLACMAYVDLNPLRAGIAELPETSDYTSIQARIQSRNDVASGPARIEKCLGGGGLRPVSDSGGVVDFPLSAIDEDHYLELVDWTGRSIRDDKPVAIPSSVAPILERLRVKRESWPSHVQRFGKRFKLAAGHWETLKAHAKVLGRQWLQGISGAKAMYEVRQ